MKIKTIIGLIIILLLLVLINYFVFFAPKDCFGLYDCKEGQYCDSASFKCRNIDHECESDNDCPGYETCKETRIGTGWVCEFELDKKCPREPNRRICKLTHETQIHCEQDSDCVFAINPNNCCYCPQIYNKDVVDSYSELVIYEEGKDYSEFRDIDCSGVFCAACMGPSNLTCFYNECIRSIILEIPDPYVCPPYETIDCMPSIRPESIKYCSGDYSNWIANNCNISFTW